jgi:hypothetical protein
MKEALCRGQLCMIDFWALLTRQSNYLFTFDRKSLPVTYARSHAYHREALDSDTDLNLYDRCLC